MNSFSSTSQMREPLPRAMNGGSPPTERKARTGEFTPPGIMLSARCCKRRDCSTFREVVEGIECSRRRRCRPTRLTTIAAPAPNELIRYSRCRHHRATSRSYLVLITCPSNREGSRTASGAPGCPYFLLAPRPVSLKVRAHDLHQFISCNRLLRGRLARRIEHVKSHVIFQQFRHKSVHRSACRRDELQYISTVLALIERAFHSVNLPANAPHPQFKFLLFPQRMSHVSPQV